MNQNLRELLEPYVGQDLGQKAQKLRLAIRVGTAYNDETYDLFYDVREVEALDSEGAVIAFRDPQTGQAFDATQMNWREPLERVFWGLEERYGTECWSEDGVTFLSLVGEDWPEDGSDLEGMNELKLPKTVLLDMEGNVLNIEETKASDFLEDADNWGYSEEIN